MANGDSMSTEQTNRDLDKQLMQAKWSIESAIEIVETHGAYFTDKKADVAKMKQNLDLILRLIRDT